jgi:4-amino-4-deoxychorismate lyase
LSKDYLINGLKNKGLNPFDRGLMFGDGVFRTFKVINGKPQHWPLHFRVLQKDCKVLKIVPPSSSVLLGDIKKLFPDKGTYVGKIIVTRGESDRGYSLPKKIKPNRILLKSKYIPIKKEIFTKGVAIKLCKIHSNLFNKMGSSKHLNRLENVMAKIELTSSFFDGLLLDEQGFVIECASHNIYLRMGKTILTPLLKDKGVVGVSQDIILNFAKKQNYKIKSCNIKLDKIIKSDEFFISNSINGVIPVRSFSGKQWKDFSFTNEFNSKASL